jgi:membrane protein implicated in regulation of membrane protease activity
MSPKQRIVFILATIRDVAAILTAAIYVLYVGVMLFLRLGNIGLNISMLAVTILYIGFLWWKILYINRKKPGGKLAARTKIIYKYTKGLSLNNTGFTERDKSAS